MAKAIAALRIVDDMGRGVSRSELDKALTPLWELEYAKDTNFNFSDWVMRYIRFDEAKDRLEDIKSNIRRGMAGLPQTRKFPTLLEYCEKYLKQISGTTKENTYLNKERATLAIRRHLGDYRLDKLSPFLAESFQANRIEKDGVSSATANIDLSILRGILGMAVREGLINKNPCVG
jgi:hypothetical protein